MPGLAPLIAHRGCAMEWAPRVLDISSHPPFRVTHTNLESPPTHLESPTQIRSIQNKHGPHMVYVL